MDSKEQTIDNLIKILSVMPEQFIILIQSNNKLLEENLRLWKENVELKKNGTK